jgi:hypothetical protein
VAVCTNVRPSGEELLPIRFGSVQLGLTGGLSSGSVRLAAAPRGQAGARADDSLAGRFFLTSCHDLLPRRDLCSLEPEMDYQSRVVV